MFPLPPKKDPKAIVAAFLQSVSNKPALPQAVARAAPQIVRPPAPAVRGGNNLDALTLGGGALGAGLGGLAVSALGGPVGLGLGIGGALGVAAPQIYDYFTRPSGPPPPTLPQSILNKPSSAPQYNIGVNRSQTYREGGVFGPQPKIQGWNGDTPLLEAPPTDGSFISQMANWATQKAWEGKLANEKQAFENPLREATLGLPGRMAKNYVGDLGLSLLTLPERLKGVASRTSAMPSNISKPYGFLFGQNPEWSPNEKEGKGLVMELLRTLEPEGQGIEQAYGFIRGVTGFGANSREQALNYKLSDLKLDAGKRADEISKFRKTGRWPTELVETPDAVDFVGAHLSDSINNAEATFNKLPVGEQMLAFFLFPEAAEQLLPKVIPKLGKMERAYAPSGSLLSDVSMIKKGVERTIEMQRQSVLAYTNKATPFITHSNNAISGLIGNTDWVHPNTALQGMRRFFVSKGFSTFDLDQASKARIAIEHGLEPILEQFFRLGDGDNFGQILDGLMDINNYGVGGFIEEATSKESIALKMFEDMRMLDEPVSKQMSKITGLEEGTIINPLNSTNGLIGRKILSNMIEGVTEQSELVRLGKQETLVDLLNTVRNTDFSKIKSKAEYDIAKNLVGESQKRLVDWALNSTLQVDFKVKDLDAFKKVGDWKKWQSFFAKMYHIGPVPGVGVRNVLSDVTKLYLQDRELMTVNSDAYLSRFMGPERKLFSQIRGQSVGKQSVSSRGVEGLEIGKKPNAFIEGGAMVMKGGEDFMHRHITAAVIKKVMNRFASFPQDASDLKGLPVELIDRIEKSVKGALTPNELIKLQQEYLTNPNAWFLHPSFSKAFSDLDMDGISLEISSRVKEAMSKYGDDASALKEWIRKEILRVNSKKKLITNPAIKSTDNIATFKIPNAIANELSATKAALGGDVSDIDVALKYSSANPEAPASKVIQETLASEFGLSPDHIKEQERKVAYHYDHPDFKAGPTLVRGLNSPQVNREVIAQGSPDLLRNARPNPYADALYHKSMEMFDDIAQQMNDDFAAIHEFGEGRKIDLSKFSVPAMGANPAMSYPEYLDMHLTDTSVFKKRFSRNGYTSVPANQMFLLQDNIGSILRQFNTVTGKQVSELVSDVELAIAKSIRLERGGEIPEVSSAAYKIVSERMYKIKHDAVNELAWSHYSIISEIEGNSVPKIELLETPNKITSQEVEDLLKLKVDKATGKAQKLAQSGYAVPFAKGKMDPMSYRVKMQEYTAAINSIKLNPRDYTEIEISSLRKFPKSDLLPRQDAIDMLRNLGIETLKARAIVESTSIIDTVELAKKQGKIKDFSFLHNIEEVLQAATDSIPMVEPENIKLFQSSRDSLRSNVPVIFANEQLIKVKFKNKGEETEAIYRIDNWISKDEVIVTKQPFHQTDEAQQFRFKKQTGVNWGLVGYDEKVLLQKKHADLKSDWFPSSTLSQRGPEKLYTPESYVTNFLSSADMSDPVSRNYFKNNRQEIERVFNERRNAERSAEAQRIRETLKQHNAEVAAGAEEAAAAAPAAPTEPVVNTTKGKKKRATASTPAPETTGNVTEPAGKFSAGKFSSFAINKKNAEEDAIVWTIESWVDAKLAKENMSSVQRQNFYKANQEEIQNIIEGFALEEQRNLQDTLQYINGELAEVFENIASVAQKATNRMRNEPWFARWYERNYDAGGKILTPEAQQYRLEQNIQFIAKRRQVKNLLEKIANEEREATANELIFLKESVLSDIEKEGRDLIAQASNSTEPIFLYDINGNKMEEILPFTPKEIQEYNDAFGLDVTDTGVKIQQVLDSITPAQITEQAQTRFRIKKSETARQELNRLRAEATVNPAPETPREELNRLRAKTAVNPAQETQGVALTPDAPDAINTPSNTPESLQAQEDALRAQQASYVESDARMDRARQAQEELNALQSGSGTVKVPEVETPVAEVPVAEVPVVRVTPKKQTRSPGQKRASGKKTVAEVRAVIAPMQEVASTIPISEEEVTNLLRRTEYIKANPLPAPGSYFLKIELPQSMDSMRANLSDVIQNYIPGQEEKTNKLMEMVVNEFVLVAIRASKSGLNKADAEKEFKYFSQLSQLAEILKNTTEGEILSRAKQNIIDGFNFLRLELDRVDARYANISQTPLLKNEIIRDANNAFREYRSVSGLKRPGTDPVRISLDELFAGRLKVDNTKGGYQGLGDHSLFTFGEGTGGGGGIDDILAETIGTLQDKFITDGLDATVGAKFDQPGGVGTTSSLNQQMLTGTEQEKLKVSRSVKALQNLFDSIDIAKNEKIVSAVDPQNAAYVNSIQKYFNKNLRELTLARTVAERTAATSVDNYIYNYGEKYNYDHIMEMAFGYPHWYLRTFSDYPRQILSDPNYLSKLFSWNRDINSINEDDSNLPLWMRASVPLNIEKFGLRDIMGTDTVYLPILSQLSPLESLLNGDFTNATREKSSLGSLYNKIYGWGPGPHALVPLAIGTTLMGLSKLNNNESQMDEASQYFGYLGSQTRLLPLLTAQIEKSGAALPISGGVAVDAPLMLMSSLGAFGAPNANIGFRALMAASSMAQFFATHAFTKDGLKFVGPVYDQRRVANVLTAWGNEPGKVINGIAITPEILQDAAIVSRDPYLLGARKEYSSAYSIWSSAVTESRAQKLLPQLLSYFGGPGVSARGENEILQEQMYNRVDKLYDMQKDPATNKDDYEKAWLSFSIQYPNFPVYSMFKKYGNDAFQVYAYSALSRVGRGASAKAVYDTVGLDYNVVNKFFANKGKFEYGTEHAQFKEGIVRLALLLQSPDMSTKQEWGEAGQLYHQLQREMENMFPGTTAMQDVYFDLDTKDRGQFLMDHLDLKTRMDTELATMVQDPKYKTKMAPYYVSIKDAGDFLKMSYTSRDPQKAAAYQIYLENSRDWAAKKEKQFLADFDLFEFHRGYNKVVANLDNSIASLTAGLNLPKLPKIRLDSPEIEARKTMQNALETMSTKNLQQQFKSNAIMSGMGAGATGAVGMAGGTGGAGATSMAGMAGMAGNDLLSSWEYLYSQKAAPTINYVSELGDQLKFQTLQPLLEGLNGNSVSFANALNAPLLSGKWATFQDPLKWEESLVNYVKMLGGENLRSSMMLEASRGVPFDPKQMVWSKVIGTVKSLSNAEIGMLMSKHPELRDLPQVKAESANYGGPTLNALFDVVGASVNIQEDGTISISGETLKKSKSGSGSGSGSNRLKSGDIEDYISKWSKHYYGNNIEQLYDQYIMVNVSQGEVAGRQFWKKYPQLAQYQAFSNKLWDRYKKNKGGPPIANRKKDLDNIIKGVGVMVGSSRQKAMGDKNQGAFSVMSSMIKNSGLSKLPPSSVESRYGNGNRIDGKIYANVISVIKAKNPQLAVSFAEFIQTNPTRRQALLQANPDLSRYITLFTPEQLGEIEDSYNVGLEIGGDSLSRGGGVRVYKRRTGRTGL